MRATAAADQSRCLWARVLNAAASATAAPQSSACGYVGRVAGPERAPRRGDTLSRGPRLAEGRVPSDTIPLVCEASDGEAVRVKPLAEERSAFSAARAMHGETPNE